MHSQEASTAEYDRQTDSDLAHRSSAGGLVYLGFLAALWATSDYYSTHPALLAAISGISLLCGATRSLLGYRFDQMYAWSRAGWRWAYFVAVNLNILAWGLFLMATFLLFGYNDRKTLLLLICLAGTAPIALAALTPNPAMLRSFLAALTTPIIVANLATGGKQGYTMAMVFSWYLLFALAHARILHRQYKQYTLEKFALAGAKKAAEDASQAKSAFLANMSHELRTPLNVILGMTHLALNSTAPTERRQYLQLIRSSSETLLQLLNGLLDFSRIEAGKLELETVPLAVRELADETLQSFSAEVKAKGLKLHSRVEEGVPVYLSGDPIRLRQVLVNVVGNAVKFTSHGEIELRVSRVTDPSEGIVLQFTVRDTGIGIALEKQRSIFEAFEQADSSTTRKYGGTGLGLAISSRIVERMGGRMWVESQPGAGSSFHWTARFATGAGHEAWSSPDIQGYARKADAKHIWRILVAEDHDVSRQLLQRLLEIRGYWVTAVSNGNEVLRELDQYSFDLVLMDIHMPELDGLAATAEIRRREKEGKHIPIIALTAEAASGLRERYLAMGLTEYLAKPIKPQKLFELIESILRTPSVN